MRSPGNVRKTWGKRVLLATVPTAPAPYLLPYSPKSFDTVIDTGPIGISCPVHVEVRFALPSPVDGSPVLPFSQLLRTPVLGNNALLNFTLRRGIDELAPVTVDKTSLGVGLNNHVVDRAWFDVVNCSNLGLDVELTGNADPTSALWVEAVATPIDFPTKREIIGGYLGTVQSTVAAFAGPVALQLLPARVARRQLFVINTSTKADLWLYFYGLTCPAVIIPKGGTARYESATDSFCGLVFGCWHGDPAPDGQALITEGVDLL